MYASLRQAGWEINHKKVQRIMAAAGLKGRRPKEKYHSYQGEVGTKADNILARDFVATKPNEKWTTDVTQFNLSFGKVYLSPIIDMFTNEVIAFDISLNPNFTQTKRMLDQAFKHHKNLTGLILHSDQGWQYRMDYYIRVLKERGIVQSMSRKGNCFDNAIMESFFAKLKNEFFYGYERSFKTFEEFKAELTKYISYYNKQRIQAKTKWMPPLEYREASIVSL